MSVPKSLINGDLRIQTSTTTLKLTVQQMNLTWILLNTEYLGPEIFVNTKVQQFITYTVPVKHTPSLLPPLSRKETPTLIKVKKSGKEDKTWLCCFSYSSVFRETWIKTKSSASNLCSLQKCSSFIDTGCLIFAFCPPLDVIRFRTRRAYK